MCELFAMSSSCPATVTYSMREFASHGGLTADHADGWGLAYVEDRDARVFRDVDAAAASPYLEMVSSREFRSEIVISHIRRATQGEIALRNTQPFARELGGRVHLFAHNGDLHAIGGSPLQGSGRYRPIGETDSERAFCALLDQLWPLWSATHGLPDLSVRLQVLADFAREMRKLGPANFVYTDGEVVFLHGHRRKDISTGVTRPPGLHLLCRSCQASTTPIRVPGLRVNLLNQHVLIAASVPLTDEPWSPLAEGELVAVSQGRVLHRVPGTGSGLDSSSFRTSPPGATDLTYAEAMRARRRVVRQLP